MKKLVLLITGFAVVMIIMAAAADSYAAERPEIIQHQVTRLDNGLNFNIIWQSANPVTRVVISAGREQKEIKIDEYDNRRNPDGYSGEISALVPIDGTSNNLQYTIQLEDDIRLRSETLAGKVSTQNQAIGQMGLPGQMPPPPMLPGQQHGAHPNDDAGWGQEMLKPMPSVNQQQGGPPAGGTVVDIMGKLMDVMERHDTPPSMTAIKVNILSADNVSFSNKAIDDKGIREVRFKVLDSRGLLVGVQVLSDLGKVWEGTSQTFQLGGGNFSVTAQAIDTGGNFSKAESASFVLSGQAKELTAVQDPPPTAGTATPGAAAPQAQVMQPFDQQQNVQQQNSAQPVNTPPQQQQPAPAVQIPVQQQQAVVPQQAAPVIQEQQPSVQQPTSSPQAPGQSVPGL